MSGAISARERPSGIVTFTTFGGRPSWSASSAAVKLMSLCELVGARLEVAAVAREPGAQLEEDGVRAPRPSARGSRAICAEARALRDRDPHAPPSPSPLNGWKSETRNQAMPSDSERGEATTPIATPRMTAAAGAAPPRRSSAPARSASRRAWPSGRAAPARVGRLAGSVSRVGCQPRRPARGDSGGAALDRRPRGLPRARRGLALAGARPRAPRAYGRPERAAAGLTRAPARLRAR